MSAKHLYEKVWTEDDAAPDSEGLGEACQRLIGEPLRNMKYWGKIQRGVTNLGDGTEFVVDVGGYTWKILSSYPGNSAIWKSR